jgi:hypothetical protein
LRLFEGGAAGAGLEVDFLAQGDELAQRGGEVDAGRGRGRLRRRLGQGGEPARELGDEAGEAVGR